MKLKSENIAAFIIRNRILILLIIIVVSLASFSQLKNLKIYNELDIWLDRTGPEYSNYMQFVQDFGTDESIIIFYHSDSLTENTQLKLNHLLTDSLEAIAGVKQVISLSTINVPSGSLIGPASVPLLPLSTNNPHKLKERLLRYKTLRNYIISSDGNTTSFIILPDSGKERTQVLADVKNQAENLLKEKGEFVLFGIVPLKEELRRLSRTESKNFLLFSILIILILNFLIFRRFKEALLPLVIAIITIVWILGLIAVLDIGVNLVISVLPLVLLVLSIAFSIHFLTGQIKSLEVGASNSEAVVKTFSRIFKKCLYSAMTTAIALIAFSLSNIMPLFHFGIFAFIGVILAFLITFTLLPVIYSFVGISPRKPVYTNQNEVKIRTWVNWLNRNRRPIYIASIIILALSVAGISRLKFNTDQVSYFKDSNYIHVSNEKAAQWFDGVFPIELVFRLDSSLLENKEIYFNQFYLLEEKLSKIPEIKSWQSPVSILEDYGLIKNKTLDVLKIKMGGKQSSEILSHFISEDGHYARISIKTKWLNDVQSLLLMKKIEKEAEELFMGTGVSFYFTGSVPVFAHLSSRLVQSQVNSILFAFLFILTLFLVIYRNVRIAIICLVPNVFPVAGTLGLMGFLDIPLDVATVLIASISFGIAIDDTIHFVSTYTESISSKNKISAISEVFIGVGKPLIATSFLLISGFLVMVFSDYKPIIYMGLFISVNVFLAIIYDLILLPAILLFRGLRGTDRRIGG